MNATTTSCINTTGATRGFMTAATPYFEGTTYTEQVKELEAIGGDPSFLEPPTSWDGSVDDSAHFGGWEEEALSASSATAPAFSIDYTPSYMELKRDIEAVGGDPTFLDGDETSSSSEWDGGVDESAHLGGWEKR